MKSLKPTILALTLTMVVSSTAFGGNIGGLRTAGNIGGLRSAGNIGGTRSNRISPSVPNVGPEQSRIDLESTFAGSFVGLIRMLLDSGALL
jgi:hypothetical protein